MNALEFHLNLLQPVLIADPVTGDENSAAGLAYIPGSVMRGVLAQLFSGGQRITIGGDFARLFFGSVRFLNAYPLIDGSRARPVPLSWRHEYAAGLPTGTLIDLVTLGDSELPGDDLKPLKDADAFCAYHASSPALSGEEDDESPRSPSASATLHTANRQVDVHIFQHNRKSVSKNDSGVFRYTAIAAGEAFAGAIVSEDPDALEEIARLIPHGAQIKIGKSRTAGYGLIEVTYPTNKPRVQSGWQECIPAPTSLPKLIMTLLSDAIVRDQNGNDSTDIALAAGTRPVKAFARTRIVGGFNRAWGLPLPQARAIAAGSVFVFDDDSTLRGRLELAARDGIGERRIEGFGRMAINWHGARTIDTDPYRIQPTRVEVTESVSLVEGMIERMWRAQLEKKLAEAIQSALIQREPISNAQLSRARGLAREALRYDQPGYLAEQLKGARRKALEQFERARVENQSMLNWIYDLSEKPETVELRLGLGSEQPRSIGSVKLSEEKRNCLRREFAMRLVDGVMRRASREGGR